MVSFMEMYTCESPTQAYVFLWLTFGKCLEDLQMLKYCGYDRACDLHPFIEGMSKKGGVGAKIIDEDVKFIVDKFHCLSTQNLVVCHWITQSVFTILTWRASRTSMEQTQSVQSKHSTGLHDTSTL